MLLKVDAEDRKDTKGLKVRLKGPTEDRKGWADKKADQRLASWLKQPTEDWQAESRTGRDGQGTPDDKR